MIPSTGNGRIGESDADSESDGNLPLAAAIIRRHSGVPMSSNTTSERQFPRRSGIGHDANTRGKSIVSNATTTVASTRGRSNTRVIQDRIAPCTEGRDVVSTSEASGSERRRTTRGVKRLRRYQGRSLPFTGEEYDPSDGRPNLDDNGIRDASGSRPTKKLVVSRDDTLRLRSISLQTDDDNSTDESDEDPRCVEANDPTIRLRSS
jgi:hypothetical protein